MTKMQQVQLEKITLNVGVGQSGEPLQRAKELLEKISSASPVLTAAKDRNPTFKIRKGDLIGAKVTLRKAKATDVLGRCLKACENSLLIGNFDKSGNVSFGVREYIDVPGMKYDPKLGMMGFDVAVTLSKPGVRIQRRKIGKTKLPQKQKVAREEAIAYIKDNFKVDVKEKEDE